MRSPCATNPSANLTKSALRIFDNLSLCTLQEDFSEFLSRLFEALKGELLNYTDMCRSARGQRTLVERHPETHAWLHPITASRAIVSHILYELTIGNANLCHTFCFCRDFYIFIAKISENRKSQKVRRRWRFVRVASDTLRINLCSYFQMQQVGFCHKCKNLLQIKKLCSCGREARQYPEQACYLTIKIPDKSRIEPALFAFY